MPSSLALRSRRIGLVAAVALVGALLVPTAALAGGSATQCVVTNVTQNRYRHSLQDAVNIANAGDVLWVSGTCVGSTLIDRDLVIRGFRTSTSGPAILDGGSVARVLEIQDGVTVNLRGLTVRHGDAGGDFGGGILNHGTARLTDVIVRANKADSGGGIFTTGHLSLNGHTVVRHNVTTLDDGAGVYVDGTSASLNDRSTIRGNSSGRGGGGVYIIDGRFAATGNSTIRYNHAVSGGGVYSDFSSTAVLKGSSSVDHNTAVERGGGVMDNERVTLKGSSTVHDNVAEGAGGGILQGCFTVLTGAVSHVNVFRNQPNNLQQDSGC